MKYTNLNYIYKIKRNSNILQEVFCRIFKSQYYLTNIWMCNYLNEEHKMTTNISDQGKQKFSLPFMTTYSLTKL